MPDIDPKQVPDCFDLFIKYQIVYGDDWVVTTGIEEGITQICQRSDYRHDFVFNFPLDVTLKSTSPHGWPQIVVSTYGKDWWGHEVLRGYGVARMPICIGSNQKKTIGLFTLEPSNMLTRLSGWLSGRSPELYDPRLLTRNKGREVLKTKSKGCVHVRLHVVSKDVRLLGYTLGRSEIEQMTAAIPSFQRETPWTSGRDEATSRIVPGSRTDEGGTNRKLSSGQELNEITPVSPEDDGPGTREAVVPRPRRRTRKNNDDEQTTSTS